MTLHTAELTNWFLITFMMGSLLHSLVSNTLDFLNRRDGTEDISKKTKELHGMHKLMKEFYPLKVIQRCVRYESERSLFSDLTSSVTSTVSSLVMIFGLIPTFMYMLISTFPDIGTYTLMIVTSSVMIVTKTLSSIPSSYYETFRIEEKYGFNRQTKGMFLSDTVKGLILSLVASSAFVSVINFALTHFGRFEVSDAVTFALCMYITVGLFGFTFSKIYEMMFCKMTPITDRKLLKTLEPILKAGNYDPKRVFIVDASRRSSHSNAYVTGFGRFRKIVLFDTLLKKYTNSEIAAILGHEIGHAKLGHLWYGRIIGLLRITAASAITFSLIYNPSLYHAFGFSWVNDTNVLGCSTVGFFLSIMLISSVSWMMEPFESWLSRKFEFAADEYSTKLLNKTEPMVSSLVKLYSENLSNPFGNDLYEAWNSSHPSLIRRIRAVLSKNEKAKMKNKPSVRLNSNNKPKTIRKAK